MGTDEVKSRLRKFLKRSLEIQPRDDEDIFVVGGTTSLFTMELVLFIEREFDVALEDVDLERSNLCSIDAMAALVERKFAPIAKP